MACCDCRYYKLDADVYPCSECESGNMFLEDDGEPVSKDILILINEVRQLKTVILEVLEELKKDD